MTVSNRVGTAIQDIEGSIISNIIHKIIEKYGENAEEFLSNDAIIRIIYQHLRDYPDRHLGIGDVQAAIMCNLKEIKSHKGCMLTLSEKQILSAACLELGFNDLRRRAIACLQSEYNINDQDSNIISSALSNRAIRMFLVLSK